MLLSLCNPADDHGRRLAQHDEHEHDHDHHEHEHHHEHDHGVLLPSCSFICWQFSVIP